jgi:hypothetical protein
MKWSKWIDLDEKNLNRIDKMPGVYEIRYSKPIPRLLGVEKEGILMIGCGKNLRRRITQFLKSIRKPSEGGYKLCPHIEGYRFYELYLDKKLEIKKNPLKFRFAKLKTKAIAEKKEEELLKTYQMMYGELPPLNNRGGV